ncbi:type II toxin-antitoxin system Phd/YefM family antitoxin [Desulfobacter sp. UBA2225]|uniref:type II toxin-antitoxin system Phd/YefM family antitoxin n=1 Tax=Desulfobacter sp. UBA2225 TaxID=1961413 RepID=UPI00257C04DB|nr:type II toxin-antitoxin system prevent-host-death family antitoxin [Desulfobacter sp. UBA2225]
MKQEFLIIHTQWVRMSKKKGTDKMIVNVSEAKAKLSKLIDMAYQGEEVIIAKNNLPLVKLVAHKMKSKRKLGQMKGQIIIPDDFLEEDEEVNVMFYGEEE